jgi:inositol phosphorylceramide synthase catalytic subunit
MNYPVAPVSHELSWRGVMIAAAASAAYLLISFLLIGFKTDQLVLAAIFSTLYLASAVTRKFILGFSVFIVFWIIFDYMKAFPNYWFSAVHVKGLYDAEAYLFGIAHQGVLLTPNEYWEQHSFALADVLSGIFYLCWIPVPLGFATFLFYKDRDQFIRFSLTFLLVNLLGFLVYYLYPAAPPWYVRNYGFDFIQSTPGNTAGLSRFDQFFDVAIFQSLYSKSSNVFAAMPSLHSAYPLIVLYFAWKNKLGPINFIFGLITAGIWFAAVYTGHHYVLDVLAGITTAAAGIGLFNLLMRKNEKFRGFVRGYTTLIS